MTFTRRQLHGTVAALSASALLLVGAGPARAADVELAARLHPAPRFHYATGHAEYESHHGGAEFEVHLAGVRRLHGQRLAVRVHGTFLGTMGVSSDGRAHLDRHTGVRVRVGDIVRIRTHVGVLVAAGTFDQRYGHHD